MISVLLVAGLVGILQNTEDVTSVDSYLALLDRGISDEKVKDMVATLHSLMADAGREAESELVHDFGFVVLKMDITPRTFYRFKNRFQGNGLVSISRDGAVSTAAIDGTWWGLSRTLSSTTAIPKGVDVDPKGGEGVRFYILDSGCQCDTPELVGRCTEGGWFSTIGASETKSGDARDDNGHGTYVASLAAGTTTSLAPAAHVVSVKIMDSDGQGTLSDLVKGLYWTLRDHRTAGKPPAIINLSLTGPASVIVNSVIDYVVSQGLHIVTSAGNAATDACNFSPASSQQSITVAATGLHRSDAGGARDTRWASSNYGSCVDVNAPGENIRGSRYGSNDAADPEERYTVLSGTSAAAPLVSSVLATHLSGNPDLTPSQAKTWLLGSAALVDIVGLGEIDKKHQVTTTRRFLHLKTAVPALAPPLDDLRVDDTCFGHIEDVPTAGTLSYPSKEGTYDSGILKCWNLKCTGRTYMKFTLFDLETGYDFLQINGREFTGYMKHLRDAQYGDAFLRFSADGVVGKRGFVLEWQCLHA